MSERILHFGILGDSAAAGVGDTDQFGISRGWSYYLAQAFETPLVTLNVARPGAQSAEVLNSQLPLISTINPDIVAVIVGGNDLLRNGFRPETFKANLHRVLQRLHGLNCEILLLELHDPTKILPIPRLLKRVLKRRVLAVNNVTRALAHEFGTILLSADRLPETYNLKSWHFDRMHPSKFGHQRIASEFARLLRARGWKIGDVDIHEPLPQSRKTGIAWMLRKGTPWFVKRSVDLLPCVVILCVIEFFREKFPLRARPTEAEVFHPHFQKTSEELLPRIYEEKVS